MTTITDRAVRWLSGDAADRARHRDGRERLDRVGAIGTLVGVPQVIASFWVGPVLVVLVVVAAVTIAAMHWGQDRVRRSEVVVAAGSTALIANTSVAVWCSGGSASPLLCLVAVTTCSQAICFRLPVMLSAGSFALVATTVSQYTAPALRPDQVPPSWLHSVSFAVLIVMLSATCWALVHSEATARAEATSDVLTGLLHRRALAPAWAEMRGQDRGTGTSTALVMIDIDHFKAVNDTWGHERGDDVLVALARRLGTTVRPDDVVVRLGGEEFVVLLPATGPADAEVVAERIRSAVAAEPLAGLPLTVSCGVRSLDPRVPEVELAAVLRDADGALYAAKHQGRNRVVSADPTGGTEVLAPPAGVG